MIRMPTNRVPTHPGEMLLGEFLKPMGLSQRDLADGIITSPLAWLFRGGTTTNLSKERIFGRACWMMGGYGRIQIGPILVTLIPALRK